MKVVCSWCRVEGRPEFVGEKAPFDDTRETHGICLAHRDEVQARWRASLQRNEYVDSNDGRGVSLVLFHWSGLLNIIKRRFD